MYTSTAKVYPCSTYDVQMDYETSTAANIRDLRHISVRFVLFLRQNVTDTYVQFGKECICAPLLVDFIIQWLLQKKGGGIIRPVVLLFQLLLYRQCSFFFLLNNMVIRDTLLLIYPRDLEIKDTSITSIFAPVDTIGRLYTTLNDNCVHFSFQIRNFPYLSSYITYISSVWCIHIIADPLLQSL